MLSVFLRFNNQIHDVDINLDSQFSEIKGTVQEMLNLDMSCFYM